jgi:hypothetical protein
VKAAGCNREPEVFTAVTTGGWPHQSSRELQGHVVECAVCADLVEVALLLAADHARGLEKSSVPSAGQVWWRARVRARAEARRAAERPMHIVQAITAACVVGGVAGGLGWAAPWMRHAGTWLHAIAVPAELDAVWWLAIATWLILAPVALYLVFARE